MPHCWVLIIRSRGRHGTPLLTKPFLNFNFYSLFEWQHEREKESASMLTAGLGLKLGASNTTQLSYLCGRTQSPES